MCRRVAPRLVLALALDLLASVSRVHKRGHGTLKVKNAGSVARDVVGARRLTCRRLGSVWVLRIRIRVGCESSRCRINSGDCEAGGTGKGQAIGARVADTCRWVVERLDEVVAGHVRGHAVHADPLLDHGNQVREALRQLGKVHTYLLHASFTTGLANGFVRLELSQELDACNTLHFGILCLDPCWRQCLQGRGGNPSPVTCFQSHVQKIALQKTHIHAVVIRRHGRAAEAYNRASLSMACLKLVLPGLGLLHALQLAIHFLAQFRERFLHPLADGWLEHVLNNTIDLLM
ncbi:hypothetical protein BCR44DRAFT_1422840 [Catenaria anguillulae PL171]|uniref:Secreted protein n=1 Tax=Catenaria anguillulae PL171 TaxID=765915 RepID=A0A1Y2I5X3_9FUNG|nr:hypothetical protein BCR44DRAFT_1422840 [Catenaria anguillulae PL171]